MADDNEDEKKEFIKNRTFQQQFDGIYNSLKQKLKENFFVYRVYNLKVPHDFAFTYNKVSFYSPAHPKMVPLFDSAGKNDFYSHFLNKQIGLFAVVKAEYYSLDVASNEAVAHIANELKFVNRCLNFNCVLEPYTFLLTNDFLKVSGFSGDAKDRGHSISQYEVSQLQNNPYRVLEKYATISKDKFLLCEPLYVEALTTKSADDYWRYLENLLDLDDPIPQVIKYASSLLILNSEDHYREKVIRPYILEGQINSLLSILGIPREKGAMRWPINDFESLRNRTTHPFLSHLLNEYFRNFTVEDYVKLKKHYQRVLWETQSERNFFIHKAIKNDKASIFLKATLGRLITRLRWIITKGIEESDGIPFHDILRRLLVESDKLLK